MQPRIPLDMQDPHDLDAVVEGEEADVVHRAAFAQVNGQPPATRGSEQRREILAAIRPSVEAELGPNVEFVVTCIQVGGGWAIVNAKPQRRGGRKISPRILDDWENRDGLTVSAVLRFRNGRWHLVDKAIGATDVWYDGLAPRSLMRSRCS